MPVRQRPRIRIALLWTLFAAAMVGMPRVKAQEHGAHATKEALGSVEFPVPCTAEAQKSFTRGVALLHSFTYQESAEAFRDAAAKDAHCAMAHWGLAMTEFNQLWEPYAGPEELKPGSSEILLGR